MKNLKYVSIPDRLYYYLLDFNDRDEKKSLYEISNGRTTSINNLSFNEINLLFIKATTSDLLLIKEIKNE
jgi:hypothetical protein